MTDSRPLYAGKHGNGGPDAQLTSASLQYLADMLLWSVIKPIWDILFLRRACPLWLVATSARQGRCPVAQEPINLVWVDAMTGRLLNLHRSSSQIGPCNCGGQIGLGFSPPWFSGCALPPHRVRNWHCPSCRVAPFKLGVWAGASGWDGLRAMRLCCTGWLEARTPPAYAFPGRLPRLHGYVF